MPRTSAWSARSHNVLRFVVWMRMAFWSCGVFEVVVCAALLRFTDLPSYPPFARPKLNADHELRDYSNTTTFGPTYSMFVVTAVPPRFQAPLAPSAGGAGYALRLQGSQCLEVASSNLDDTGELIAGMWLQPSQVIPVVHESALSYRNRATAPLTARGVGRSIRLRVLFSTAYFTDCLQSRARTSR